MVSSDPGHARAGQPNDNEEYPMHPWFAPLKIFGMVVVLLMAVSMIYAGTMAIVYWTGIGV